MTLPVILGGICDCQSSVFKKNHITLLKYRIFSFVYDPRIFEYYFFQFIAILMLMLALDVT